MKKSTIAATISAIATSTLLLTSQNSLDINYLGANYILYTHSQSGLDDLNPDGLALVIGGKLNENFRLEGRFGRSISDDNVPGAALKIDDYVGFYVKGGMSFADIVFPYIALGYTKVDFEYWGAPIAETESDLSYGVGADLDLGKFKLGLEWMMLQDKKDYELQGLSLSGAWCF